MLDTEKLPCDQCDAKYIQKSHLNRHKVSIHSQPDNFNANSDQEEEEGENQHLDQNSWQEQDQVQDQDQNTSPVFSRTEEEMGGSSKTGSTWVSRSNHLLLHMLEYLQIICLL